MNTSDYKTRLAEDLRRQAEGIEDTLQYLTHEGADVPLFNQLELSVVDSCNRSCEFCPRSDPEMAPKQNLYMSLDLCRKMAEELEKLKFAGIVSLAGYSEPLLHPNIVEMVRVLSAHAAVEIYTNGDLLKSSLVEELVHAGISKIVVNMYDGPEQYAKLTKIFDAAGIRDGYVLRERWFSAEEGYGMIVTNRGGTINIGDNKKPESNAPCYYPHYYLMIDWNGDVHLCPQDWNRRLKFGNIAMTSMAEVWCLNTFNRFRRRLAAGKRDLSPCQNCNAGGVACGKKHMLGWVNFLEPLRA